MIPVIIKRIPTNRGYELKKSSRLSNNKPSRTIGMVAMMIIRISRRSVLVAESIFCLLKSDWIDLKRDIKSLMMIFLNTNRITRRVGTCISISYNFGTCCMPMRFLITKRCPELDTGINSVIPCSAPKKIDFSRSNFIISR